MPVIRVKKVEILVKKNISKLVNINEIIYFRVLNIPAIFAQIKTKLPLYEEDISCIAGIIPFCARVECTG